MCGLFGYAGRSPVDLRLLDSIANRAAERGPHAWGAVGYAHRSPTERATARHELGDYRDLRLPNLFLAGCRLVMGHCRLATTPGPLNRSDTQPLLIPGMAGTGHGVHWIAHNGTVHDPLAVRTKYALHPRTDNDSELLGLLAGRKFGTPQIRLELAILDVAPADGPAVPMAAMMLTRAELIVYRSRHPLFHLREGEGFYFGSVPWCDEAAPLPERTAMTFVP